MSNRFHLLSYQTCLQFENRVFTTAGGSRKVRLIDFVIWRDIVIPTSPATLNNCWFSISMIK